MTTPYRSHFAQMNGLLRELTKSHQVTVVLPNGFKNIQLHNLTYIKPNIYDGNFENFIEKTFESTTKSGFLQIYEVLKIAHYLTEKFLKSEEVQELLNSSLQFDLVIGEAALNEAIVGFSEHFRCPHISFATFGETTLSTVMTGNPLQMSYSPHLFLDYTQEMTFIQRFHNVIYHIFDKIFEPFHIESQEKLYLKYFPNSTNFKSFTEICHYGVSTFFINSHHSIDYSKARQPHLVEIAGLHLQENPDPLPENVKNFIESSPHGIIYFAFGSMLKTAKMSQKTKNAIFLSLSKRKEKVIMKWDDEVEVDVNKFLIGKWFPQESILAHPNVKCYIHHSGLYGHQEAIYYAKPTISVPIFMDQKFSARKSVFLEYGVKIDYTNLTENSLSWALDEVLSNRKYSEKAKELSIRFRDRPQKPAELAKYHIDYVIRHKGAKFMRSHIENKSFIELNNIDVYFSMIIFISLMIYLNIKAYQKILKHKIKIE